MNKLKENFENVLLCFDFQKVHAIMSLLGWTYFDSNNDVPSISSMKRCVKDLFDKASYSIDEEDYCHSVMSGGFKVTVYCSGEVLIEFIPVSEES